VDGTTRDYSLVEGLSSNINLRDRTRGYGHWYVFRGGRMPWLHDYSATPSHHQWVKIWKGGISAERGCLIQFGSYLVIAW
jgi:hypothetical protein